MSLSFRGLLIAFPIVAAIVGGMATITYSAAINYYRTTTVAELSRSNEAVADDLRRELALVAEAEQKAASLMARHMRSAEPADFDEIFDQAADGAFHTRPDLWNGRELSGAVRVEGIGGFLAPPNPTSMRRKAILAAFATLKELNNGLPAQIEVSTFSRLPTIC